MLFRKPGYQDGYVFLHGPIRVLRDGFSIFPALLSGKKEKTLLKAEWTDRTQGESQPPVSPSSSSPTRSCSGHMYITQSAQSSSVDFVLLSLESKYCSFARVERCYQEQEVKKESRAAVFRWVLMLPVSRHALHSRVQLCLMLPFSAFLMIDPSTKREAASSLTFFSLLDQFLIGHIHWGFQGFYFCLLPYSHVFIGSYITK